MTFCQLWRVTYSQAHGAPGNVQEVGDFLIICTRNFRVVGWARVRESDRDPPHQHDTISLALPTHGRQSVGL
jgi:hypothetical protein